MSVKNIRLVKFVAIVAITVIVFIHVLFDSGHVISKNCATDTKSPCDITKMKDTARSKITVRNRNKYTGEIDFGKYNDCKSLFSLDRPAPEERFKHIYWETILPNETIGETFYEIGDRNEMETVKDVYRKISEVLRRIRKLKYSNPEELFSEDYQSLAEVLPRVADYSTSSFEKEQTKHVTQRRSSRITKGTLPYVPCLIRDYEDEMQIFSCFRKRIEAKGSLYIHFLGDSKVRYLLHQFLEQTDGAFHFVTVAKNITRPWTEAKSDLTTGDKWTDVEFLAPELPSLRIAFSFRTFKDSPQLLRDLPEVAQLRNWATLKEPPPDLLILDYNSWVLTLHNIYGIDPPRASIDVLSILLELHARVVPLLQEISKRTRVLVLSQSRQRPNSENLFPNNRGSTADFNMDWSESTFLYILRHYGDHDFKALLESRLSKAKEMLRISDDYVKEFPLKSNSTYGKASAFTSPSQERIEAKKISPLKMKQSYSVESNVVSPVIYKDTLSTRSPEVSQHHEATKRTVSTFRDYLIPSEGTPGLWWWDGLLPLNLAEIEECQDMFRRGLEAETLYRQTTLRCLDRTHAGDVTHHDLVVTMLNLLCNTVLETTEDYCCS